MAKASRNGVRLLLALLDEAYDHPAWHGPNLRGSLRGLSEAEVSRRPRPGRHNIWELAVHSAYWKYAVRRRLRAEKRGSFELPGSNWFRCPDPRRRRRWKDDLELLDREHRALRRAVLALSDLELRRKPRGSRSSRGRMIAGVAAHDIYHAGQIRLLKRILL
jgi:hypothetical protein